MVYIVLLFCIDDMTVRFYGVKSGLTSYQEWKEEDQISCESCTEESHLNLRLIFKHIRCTEQKWIWQEYSDHGPNNAPLQVGLVDNPTPYIQAFSQSQKCFMSLQWLRGSFETYFFLFLLPFCFQIF